MHPKTGKLHKLEAIRGFVALYVVMYHLFATKLMIAGINFNFLFKFGQEAVIVFFLLSGFVIEYSFSRSSDKSFRIYFLKRFLRIYVPLIVVMTTNWGLMAAGDPAFEGSSWRVLLGNLFMLQDLPKKYGTLVGPYLNNEPLWSLSYEWWFYMLYYLLFYFKRLDAKFVFWMTLLFCVLNCIFPFFPFKVIMYFALWYFGVELARLYVAAQSLTLKNTKRPIISLGILMGILCLNAFLQGQQEMHQAGFMGKFPLDRTATFFWSYSAFSVGIAVEAPKLSFLFYLKTF